MSERAWYKIKAAAAKGAEAEIWIYEQIGESFWSEGLTAKAFVRDLAKIDAERIALHINSPGGSVFDGQAIYTALRAHPATVTTYIDGLAASIASVVALAGDSVVMARNALFMYHDPAGPEMGTAADHRKYAEILDLVTETILGVYVEKTGRDVEELRAEMAAETWLSADEALAAGFVDELAEPLAVAASSSWDLSPLGYRNAPATLAPPAPAAAGRVLSAKNETDLRSAVDLVQGVLDSAGTSGTDSAAEAAAEAPAAEAAEAETETVRVFAGGRWRDFNPNRRGTA